VSIGPGSDLIYFKVIYYTTGREAKQTTLNGEIEREWQTAGAHFPGWQKKGIKLGSAQQEKVEKGLEIRTLKSFLKIMVF